MTTKKLKQEIEKKLESLERMHSDTVFCNDEEDKKYLDDIDKAIVFYKQMIFEIEVIEGIK